jgi:hypothetical protein
MTPEQTTLMQTSLTQVAPVAETAATLNYDRLFELNPSLRGLLKEDLRAQRLKLMAMLTTAVNNRRQWDAVAQDPKQLGLPHVGYMKPTDYDTIETAFIDTLEKGSIRGIHTAGPRRMDRLLHHDRTGNAGGRTNRNGQNLKFAETQSSVPSNPNGD